MSSEPIRVSIVVFPECDPSIVYGVFDTLWAAGRTWPNIPGGGEPLFEPRLVAAEAGPMALITGVSIIPQDAIADVRRTDIVFVPNVMLESAESVRMLDRRTIGWIKEMHAGGAQLCAACGGTLVLAEAGLLDGGQATTHWAYAPLFRELFPNVTLHVERLLVQSGPGHSLVCSGGASSWQDLALLLVAKHGGTAEAIRMSKLFLYQWHRDGQLPYASMVQNANHGDGIILHCQQWIAQHYRAAGHHHAAGARVGIAEALVRPPLPRRHRLFAARLCPDACASRRRSNCSRPAPSRWNMSGARSATRMRPRSAACSAASPAWRRATIAANSSRPASWRRPRRRARRKRAARVRPNRDVKRRGAGVAARPRSAARSA